MNLDDLPLRAPGKQSREALLRIDLPEVVAADRQDIEGFELHLVVLSPRSIYA